MLGKNSTQLDSVDDSVEVLQDTHDDLNANANIQIGDVDVSDSNKVPIKDLESTKDSVEVLQDTHDDLNANANIQVGNVDVSVSNRVPTVLESEHDEDTAQGGEKGQGNFSRIDYGFDPHPIGADADDGYRAAGR